MILKLGTADQPGYLHYGDPWCGRLFTFFSVFHCHRRFTTESLRFRPPTLTSFNKYRKVSNIDQRVTMPSRHTAAITARFRHPSVTESSVALPPDLTGGIDCPIPKRAGGVTQAGAALVTDDPSPSPLKDGELHDQLST